MENGTMRRSGRVLLIVLTVLVVLAGAGAAVVLRLDTRAKEQHEMLSRAISARETWLSDTRVRLTSHWGDVGIAPYAAYRFIDRISFANTRRPIYGT